MRILIDGDACPVLAETEEVVSEFNCELIIYTDLSHNIKSEIGQVIYLERANQSVDMVLYNNCRKGDLVITQDYGLAALVLGKKAMAIDHYAKHYTEDNIDHLLLTRHINYKIRRSGGKHPSNSKRKKEDNQNFKKALYKLIENHHQN